MSNEQETTTLDEWAKVELFGHTVLWAKVTKADFGDFIRCDIPFPDGTTSHTKFINPKAIYAISPVAKDIVLRMVQRNMAEPVHAYQLPEPIPQIELVGQEESDDDDRDHVCIGQPPF